MGISTEFIVVLGSLDFNPMRVSATFKLLKMLYAGNSTLNMSRCFFITLQTVTGCPTDYIVSGSALSSHISVYGWIHPQLVITWADFQMCIDILAAPYTLLHI